MSNIETIKSQLLVDEKNIYVPKTLIKMCKTDKLMFGLLANAIQQKHDENIRND